MNSRQPQSSDKGSLHLPLRVYLAYLLVCTLLLTGVSFSRYLVSGDGSDGARVAKGVVTVNYDEKTNFVLSRDSSDSIQRDSFVFNVSNGNSEVAIRYGLVLTLDKELPSGVTINLYNGNDEKLGTFNSGQTQITVPDAGTFEAGSRKTDQYRLTFEGDFGLIDDDYRRTVTISVQAEQID